MQIIRDLPKILILAGVIVIGGFLFIYFYFTKADILRLKIFLKKELERSDIILFFPEWEKNDILSLEGFPVITSKEDHYLNLYGFGRLFIVEKTKHYKKKETPILNDMLLEKRKDLADYSLWLYRLYTFNLSEHIGKLKVYTDDGQEKKICSQEDKRYKCGTMGWQFVGIEKVDVDGQRAECIWAHPIGGNKIIIEVDLPSTLSGNFVFYRALASTSGFDTTKPDVSTKIFINDTQVYSSKISFDRSWKKERFTFKTEGRQRLKIEIFSSKEYKNHFCFNLEAI